ncbi:MAG: hypothetical protein CL760_04235 [Chloroflexi bacterium]|nr:hypothetical protein [Chloroflexota bacterium]MQG05775.1 CcmD family protein [SAR202 cluster bacterium]|tara:strand:+ start:2193 stop:2456 length:264 start_codon:yes stop_codon:yes gene_type:complete
MLKFLFLSLLLISVNLTSIDIIFADGHSQTNASIETISEEKQTNTQNDNGLIYVFIAFLITWIGFFFYLYYLSQKRRELERKINSIK